MPQIPDLTDPRYLDEVGWFLYHEKYGRGQFGGSYDAERLANSRLLLDEVVGFLGQDIKWVEDKTVVTIGCGCTGDLVAFPAAVKIAVDPLLYSYQKLGMLLKGVSVQSDSAASIFRPVLEQSLRWPVYQATQNYSLLMAGASSIR